MTRSSWISLGIAGFILAWAVFTYNNLVSLDTTMAEKRAQIEAQYQRRMDLVPNLVAAVQGAAGFERETLTALTQARTAWMQAATPQDRAQAGTNFESALGRFFIAVENYPR